MVKGEKGKEIGRILGDWVNAQLKYIGGSLGVLEGEFFAFSSGRKGLSFPVRGQVLLLNQCPKKRGGRYRARGRAEERRKEKTEGIS